MDKCEEEIKRLASLLQEHKESNTQLRTYIAQVQEDEHSRDRWKVEKTEMITAISVCFLFYGFDFALAFAKVVTYILTSFFSIALDSLFKKAF